jgi:hypothetical protein
MFWCKLRPGMGIAKRKYMYINMQIKLLEQKQQKAIKQP